MTSTSIPALLRALGEGRPDAVAIAAPERPPLTCRALFEQVEQVAGALRSAGVARSDRVALVLPNGPEMAVAFLSVASAATCAPLNPGYRAAEFEFYLSDLKPKALIVLDRESPSVAIAQRSGIRVIGLSMTSGDAAGLFSLEGIGGAPGVAVDFAGPDDLGLVLHTSGTTSKPKQVPLTHRSLCASAMNIAAGLRLGPDDRCLNVMPLFHIHGLVGALLSSLAAGGSVICAPGFQAPRFFGWLSELSPTWYTAVPSIHQSVLLRAAALPQLPALRLRFVRSSSSPLPPAVMAALEQVFGVPAIEAYGMTEATHQLATNPLPPRVRKPGSVGPAAGTEIAIAGDGGQLLPPHARGEIVVRGPTITLGYAANPEANATAFRDGWFRTGDQGYLDEDGYVFITGRLKELINRAGEKISPREIDDALLSHRAVAEALSFSLPDAEVGEEVAAAVVLRPGARASERELQAHVLERLADFKVPRRILLVDELPKGPTGKQQRVGLAERLGLTQAGAASKGDPAAPQTETELHVARVWASVLEVTTQVSLHDNFFHVGGDSVLAGLLLTRLRKELGVGLSFVDVFQGPTLKELAAAVDNARRIGNRGSLPAIGRAARNGVLPLSQAQQRLWFVEQLYPGLPAYNPVTALRLLGPLRVPALEQALQAIVSRHEALRARFEARDGVPVQQILESVQAAVPLVDLRSLGELREQEARRLAREEAWRPFKLEEGPPFRLLLLQLGDEDHILMMTIHHIAFDAWSRGIILRELVAVYRAACAGAPLQLPALPIDYGDYAVWQHEFLKGAALESDIAYWKKHLGEDPPTLELPLDRPRPQVQTFAGRRIRYEVPAGLRERLKSLSDREGCTVAITLLAVFQVLLHRITQRQTIVVGVPIAGRSQGETEGLVGLFVNELLIRQEVSGDESFERVLAKTREAMLGAYCHQDLPFDNLVQILRPARDLSRSPLFQVAFNHTTLPGKALEFGGGLSWEQFEFATGTTPFELLLDVTETPESLTLRIVHGVEIYDEVRIDRMLEQVVRLLEEVCADPKAPVSKLALLGSGESEQLREWNDTATSYPRDQSVSALFQLEAARSPESIAVECGSVRLSYRELNQRANRLARHLCALGVARGDRVGICLSQGPAVIVAMLAILKAGGAYVPLDPTVPASRLQGMLDNTAAKVLLTEAGLAPPFAGLTTFLMEDEANALSSLSGEDLELEVAPTDNAYVMYTSGSTGQPKGIAIPHRGIVRLVRNTNYVSFAPTDKVAQVTTFSFDLATFEVWGALLNGARLIQIAKELVLEPHRFAEELKRHQIDVLILATSLFHLIAVERPGAFGPVRDLLVAGEALDPGRAREVLASGTPPGRLINAYGPTENTTFSTWYWVKEVPEGATQVPIGYPLSNSQCWVLDKNQKLLPIGAEGELYLSGDGLALGYWNRLDETARAFVRAGFPEAGGARLYRTGDRARYRSDGAIEFLGRNDDQVKIRGFRIEPREIEVVLREQREVEDAAVLVRSRGGEKRLAAFVRTRKGAELTAGALRSHLSAKLPEYMIPAEWTLSGTLPLTLSGKLDRKALALERGAAPEAQVALQPEPAKAAPPNDTEARLMEIWRKLLGLESVGRGDDFFEIGGHSLLAVRLISEIEKAFGRRLPVATLIRAPTIEKLAVLLAPPGSTGTQSAPGSNAIKAPLFCVATFATASDEVPALAYRNLASALGDDQPLHVLQPPELVGTRCQESITGIAAQLVQRMKSIQPQGPYSLSGYCVGGSIAFEMACQLQARGEPVRVVALLESINPQSPELRAGLEEIRGKLTSYWSSLIQADDPVRKVKGAVKRESRRAMIRAAWELCRRSNSLQPAFLQAALQEDLLYLSSLVAEAHHPQPYHGPVVVFSAAENKAQRRVGPALGWSGLARGGVDTQEITGDHESILKRPHVMLLAKQLARYLG